MTIDARLLKEPITCTVDEIQPLELSRDNTRAAAQLRAIAERNKGAGRQQAVSALVRMTGNARAIRVNSEKNSGGR